MQESAFGSPNLAATAIVWLVNAAAVTALGVAGAYWTWTWFAPRAQPRAQAPVSAVARLDAAYPLFGRVRATAGAGAATPAAVAIRLLGVIAASGAEPGYALLQLGAKPAVAVREGGEVEPGTRVLEVSAERVVLERGGVRETLALPARGKGAPAEAKHAG